MEYFVINLWTIILLPGLMGYPENGRGYIISNVQSYDISGENGVTTENINQFSVMDINGVSTSYVTHTVPSQVFRFDLEEVQGFLAPEIAWGMSSSKTQALSQCVRISDTTMLAFDSVSKDLVEISLLPNVSTEAELLPKDPHKLNISTSEPVKLANSLSGNSTIIFAYGSVIAEQELETGHLTQLMDLNSSYPNFHIEKIVMNNDSLLFILLGNGDNSYIVYFNMHSKHLSTDLKSASNSSGLTKSFSVRFNSAISDLTLLDDYTLLIADVSNYELKVLQVQTGSIYRICRLLNRGSTIRIIPYASTEKCAGTFEPRRVAFKDGEVYVIIRNQLTTFTLTDVKYKYDKDDKLADQAQTSLPLLLRLSISLGVIAVLLLVVSLVSISLNIRLKLSRTTGSKQQWKRSAHTESANNRLEVIEMEAVVPASSTQLSASTSDRNNLSSSTPYPGRANLASLDTTIHDRTNPTAQLQRCSTLTLDHKGSYNRHQKAPLVTYPSTKIAETRHRPPAVPAKRLTDRHPIGTKLSTYQASNTNNSITTAQGRDERSTVDRVKQTDDYVYEEIPIERNNLP